MNLRLVLAAILGATGVGVGAFAAHGLKEYLEQQMIAPEMVSKKLSDCDVAVRYHLLHSLAILAVGFSNLRTKWLSGATLFWLLGILFFSGGIYVLVFWKSSLHWIIPIGGLCFIVGWLLIIPVGLAKMAQSTRSDS